MPSKVLPISIIQNSIKLTQEPPRGLRQSILRSYGSFDEKFYESCKMGYQFKRFIHPPPVTDLAYNIDTYRNYNTLINTNVHLICTQCFLEEAERKHFAKNSQSYLIREINEYNFYFR